MVVTWWTSINTEETETLLAKMNNPEQREVSEEQQTTHESEEEGLGHSGRRSADRKLRRTASNMKRIKCARRQISTASRTVPTLIL